MCLQTICWGRWISKKMKMRNQIVGERGSLSGLCCCRPRGLDLAFAPGSSQSACYKYPTPLPSEKAWVVGHRDVFCTVRCNFWLPKSLHGMLGGEESLWTECRELSLEGERGCRGWACALGNGPCCFLLECPLHLGSAHATGIPNSSHYQMCSLVSWNSIHPLSSN